MLALEIKKQINKQAVKQSTNKKKMTMKLVGTSQWTISFVQQMRMRKCYLLCASMHQHVPCVTNQGLMIALNLEMSVGARAHAQLTDLHIPRQI